MRKPRPSSIQQERIVAKIVARAKQRGINQDELASRAGISRETVSRLKRREADFGTIARLASVVGFKLDVVEDEQHVEDLERGLLDIADFEGTNK